MANDYSEQLDFLQDKLLKSQLDKQVKDKEYKFNKLKMYFDDTYDIKGIKVKQPKINDIITLGEDLFYSALSPFLYNSTLIRVPLWNAEPRIDWTKIKDIEVFMILFKTSDDHSYLQSLFPNLLLDDLELVLLQDAVKNMDRIYGLYSKSQNILIDEYLYMNIAEFFRELLNFHPKTERPKSKTAKQWIIQEEELNAATRKMQSTDNANQFLAMIAACETHPGFPYKIEEIREMNLYHFMYCVQRLHIWESSHTLNIGAYFCDTKKVDKKLFNFMREI